jgi:hypothetical protein
VLRNWKFWLGIGISVIALYFTLRDVDFIALYAAIANTHTIWFIPAIIVFFVVLACRAARWAVLMGGTPFGITWHAMNIGYMINMILPFRLGEIARAVVIGQRTQVSTATAFSSIVVERLLDLASVVLMFVLFAQFIPMDAFLSRAALVSALIIVFLLVAVGVVIWQAPRFESLLRAALSRFHRIDADAWVGRFRDFAGGFKLINTPQKALRVLGLTVGIWAAQLILAYCAMGAFMTPRFDQAGLMLVAANLGGAAPSAPGGLGPVQAFAKLALVLPFGVDPVSATALAFVWSLSQQLILIVLGLIGMFRIGMTFGELQTTRRGAAQA